MAINNVVDPTHCRPYTTAIKTDRECPKTTLIDIQGRMKRSVVLSFSYSAPEMNYKVLLTEGSDEIWQFDYVEDGELKRAAGKVVNFEYWTNKHTGLSSYYANGITPRDERIVVKFDCSIDYKAKPISIDVQNIREIKPFGLLEDNSLTQDSDNLIITLNKNAYSYMKNLYGKEYPYMNLLDKTFVTSDVEYADFLFDGGMALIKMQPLHLENVYSMNYGFRACHELEELNLFTSNKLRDAEGMFYNCHKLTHLDISDTSGIKNAKDMFHNNYELKSLTMDPSSLENVEGMFRGCNNLASIKFTKPLCVGLELQDTKLSSSAVKDIIDMLDKTPSDEPRYIRFNGVNLDPSLEEAILSELHNSNWHISGVSFYKEDTGKDFNINNEGKEDHPNNDDKKDDPIVNPDDKDDDKKDDYNTNPEDHKDDEKDEDPKIEDDGKEEIIYPPSEGIDKDKDDKDKGIDDKHNQPSIPKDLTDPPVVTSDDKILNEDLGDFSMLDEYIKGKEGE